jgi:hypothetical protein
MSISSYINSGAIWDGDTYSLKYFGVSKNFALLQRGRNTITLSPESILIPNTKLDVELIDKFGNVIPVEHPNQITLNGDIVLYITITEDIPSGIAKLYIKGTSSINADTGEALDTTYQNLIWVGLTEIKRLDDTDTPKDPEDIVFEKNIKDIKVFVKPLDFIYKEKSTDRPSTKTGTGILTYFPIEESSDFSNTFTDKPIKRTRELSKPISDASGGSSITSLGNEVGNSAGFPKIVSTQSEFTSDMVGGQISIPTPNISQFVPSSITNLGTVPTYTATILEVVNATTISVDTHFIYKVPNQRNLVANAFTATSYDINFNKSTPTTDGQKVTGYAQICFDNVATTNGAIEKVRVSAKPVGSIGGPMLLGDYDVITPNKMQDTGSFSMNPKTGVEYKNLGEVSSSNDISNYYDISFYDIKNDVPTSSDTVNYVQVAGSPTVTQSNSKLSNSLVVEPSTNENRTVVITIKDGFAGDCKADTEYKVSLDAFCEKDSLKRIPKAKIYIEGTQIAEPSESSTFGFLLGEIDGKNGGTQKDLNFTFKSVQASNKVKFNIVVQSGVWHFSNTKLEPTSTTNNSPNELCVLVPLDNLPVNKIGEEYVFIIDFVNRKGNVTNLNLITQSLTLNTNTTIDENLIINTLNSSALIQNKISGSFTSISSSFANTITNISASFSSSINTISGSLIYSGSFFESPDLIRLFRNNGTNIDVKLKIASSSYGDSDVLDYINSLGVRSGSDADTDTITTVGTSSLGSFGTITLKGSGSIELSEMKTVSGSIITIFSDSNPQNISGSIISASYNPTTGILELNRQYTSSLQVNIDTYDNWIISDGTTTSNINSGNTLTITGSSGISTTLSGCSLTINSSLSEIDTLCSVTQRGDTTNVRSCFISSADCNADGGICARGCVHLTANCASGRCDLVIDTLRGSVYICPAAGVGIGTACPQAKAGSITLNQLNCGEGVRVFNLPSNTAPTHIVSICNPTSTSYTGGGCQASLQYTCVNDLASALSSSLGSCPGTLNTTTTNTVISGIHYHAITTTINGTASTIVSTDSLGNITANNFITTSDERLKTNITLINTGLDVINKFNSYIYQRDGYTDAGFLAQEIQKVIPFSVHEDEKGYLYMRDRPILAYLHKAVLELEQRIKDLENK